MMRSKKRLNIGMEDIKMDEFKKAVMKYADKNKPTMCECPKCLGIIFIKYNDFTNGIQAMCETCGRYWMEGAEESAE